VSRQKKTLFMETTGVPAERTAAEVSSELIQAGATQIASSYENGKIVGLRWTMKVQGIDALFEMPARVEPLYRLFVKRKGWTVSRHQDGSLRFPDLWAKAERVAWRQLLRWVQAQNAMIETGMVQPMEVFTAYWIPPGQERTLFQGIIESQFKALPPAF
jgi:hypothetical protein